MSNNEQDKLPSNVQRNSPQTADDIKIYKEKYDLHFTELSEIKEDNNNELKLPQKKEVSNKKTSSSCFQSKKSKIILFSVLGGVVLISAILIIIWQTIGFGKSNANLLGTQELFVVNIKRELNEVSRYTETKHSISRMIIADQVIEEKERYTTNFVLNIRNITKQPDNTNLYDANLVIISISSFNESNSTAEEEGIEEFDFLSISDVDEFLNSLSSEDKEEFISNSNTLPIMKISFYEDGEILEMHFPSEISSLTKETMKNVASKIIPSVAKDLYIETKETPQYRMLQEIEGDKTNYFKKTDDESSLYNLEKHAISEGDVQFHNSNVNSLTETKVDNKEGVIKEVKSEGEVSFQQSSTNNDDYGEPKISANSPLAGKTNNLNENKLKSEFKSLGSSVKSEMTFVNKTINENITKLIDEFATYITFVKYEEGDTPSERLLRMLNVPDAKIFPRNINDIPTINNQEELNRLLKVESFLKPIEFSYPIFKYDHVGLQIFLNSLILIDTNSGKVTLTSVITIGSTSITLLTRTHDTELGNVLDAADNILESSIFKIEDLISKTEAQKPTWIEELSTIINPLINVLDSTYDVGSLYREPIMEVYSTITEYSKNIFEEMTSFIDTQSVSLDNKIENTKTLPYNQLSELNEIINSFLNECQNFFINIPSDILDILYSKGMSYESNLMSLIEPFSDFDLNVYYDILIQIDDAKNIYSTFMEKFLKAVENGLNDFSTSIQNKANELLSNALDDIEYIGSAMENNIIMIEIVSEDRREQTAKKTYAFREKVKTLMDEIFNRIKDSYNANIISDIKDSAKSQLEQKVYSMMYEINAKMESLKDSLKSKIPFITEFEHYINNHPNILDSIETQLLEVEEEQFNSLISVPLYELHRNFYSEQTMKGVNNAINAKAKLVIEQLYNDEQLVNDILSSLNLVDSNNIEEYFGNELSRINQNIFKALSHEKTLLDYDNFNFFIKQSKDVITNIIMTNYKLGRDYMAEINQFYDTNIHVTGFVSMNRTLLYETRCQMSPEYTNNFIMEVESNLTSMLENAFLNLGNNLTSFIKKQLIPGEVNLTRFESMQFIQTYINAIENYVNEKINPSIFNKENFDNDFKASIQNIISDSLSYNEMSQQDYYSLKNAFIDDLPICEDEKKFSKHDMVMNMGTEVGYESVKATYLINIVPNFNETIFNTSIFEVIFNDFAEAHLKLPLNEFKSKVKEFYSIMLQMDQSFSNIGNFKKLMDSYEKEANSIINQYLGESLLINLYQGITNNINVKIADYFKQIAIKLSYLKNVYVDSYLKTNVKKFLEFDETSEIILKLDNLVSTQQHKGRRTLDDIEIMFNNEFDSIMESCYKTINDTLNSTLTDIELNLPTFPFEEFIRERKGYIETKSNSIKNAFMKSKEVFANITIRSFILGVDEDDFYDIRNQNIALFKSIVGNPLRQNVNEARLEIEENAEYSLIEFNKASFQAVKLRGAMAYFDEINKLTSERILNPQRGRWDVFKSSDLITRFNHAPTYNYKVNEIIDLITEALNELNGLTKEKLEPHFEASKQNIRAIFEEMTNHKLIKTQLSEYVNSLYSIFKSSNENINNLYFNFRTQLKYLFEREVEVLYNKTEYRAGLPYYINQTQLNEEFEKLKTQIVSHINDMRSDVERLELDEKIISQTTEEYNIIFNTVIEEFQSQIDTMSLNRPEYNLLNLTYTFMDLYKRAMDSTYFDSLKDSFNVNANIFLKDNFTTIRQFLLNEIDILNNNITEFMNEEFNNYITIVSSDSTEPVNETVFIVSEYSVYFSQSVSNLIQNFAYQTTTLFENEPVKSKLLEGIPKAKEAFVFTLNETSLQNQLNNSDYLFREACSDRYIVEMSEFKERFLYKILSEKFAEAVENFIKFDGELFGNKIYNKLIDVDLMWACRGAGEKLDFIYNYLEYVLDKTTLLGSSTVTLYNNILVNINTTLQNEIILKSKEVFDEFLTQLKIKLSESFTKKFKDTIISNDFVKGAFSSRVMSVIKRAFSLGYTDKFKQHFKEVAREKWVDVWKVTLSQGIKTNINEFISSKIMLVDESLKLLMKDIDVDLIDSSFISILAQVNQYNNQINSTLNEIDNMSFIISNYEPITNYINNEILPSLISIDELYGVLQNTLITKVDETLDQFDNYASSVAEQYQTESVVELANQVLIEDNNVIEQMKEFIINLSKINSNNRRLLEGFHKIPKIIDNLNYIKRNLVEETPNINIDELAATLLSLENYLSEFRESLSKSTPVLNLITSFQNFQNKLQFGLIELSNPANSLITKLETFLTSDKFENFKSVINAQIIEINGVVNNHNTQVSAIVQTNIDILTGLYEKMLEIYNQIELNVKTTVEESLLDVKSNTDPLQILESFDAQVNPDFNIYVVILGIPFNFRFQFSCKFAYNVYFGMTKDLKVTTSSYLATTLSFSSSAGVSYVGSDKFTTYINGNLNMSDIKISSVFDMKKFKAKLDASINLHPVNVNTYMERYYCKKKRKKWWKSYKWYCYTDTRLNHKYSSPKISKNIPLEY